MRAGQFLEGVARAKDRPCISSCHKELCLSATELAVSGNSGGTGEGECNLGAARTVHPV